jgi:hypothetical protein
MSTAPKPAAMSNSDILAYARANYGYLAAFLSMPEVGPILIKAAKGGWDSNKLLGALTPTKWWKTTTASARTFDAERKLDPATNSRKITNAAAAIGAQATKDGLSVSAASLRYIAMNSLRFGWTSDQITQALGHQFHYNPAAKTQQPVVDQIKQLADQYLVPISPANMQKWGSQLIGGQIDANNLEGYIKAQAKSLFPTLGNAIDSGVTVKQYVSPYAQLAVQNGVAAGEQDINWMDPKWQQALFQVDPKTGQRTAMNLADWQAKIRTDSAFGYSKTPQAQQLGAQMVTAIGKTFGEIS